MDLRKPNEICVTIPSNLEWLSVIDKVVEGIVEPMELSEDEVNAIAISVVEAGTNAIQHGNRHDETLPVDFSFTIEDGYIEVTVRDRGPGFDIEKVLRADPTEPENILAPRGRGIFIMRSLMDEVSFEIIAGQGCWAVLRKARGAAAKARSG
jgi:serine/threonine-protein kinase RsbW